MVNGIAAVGIMALGFIFWVLETRELMKKARGN